MEPRSSIRRKAAARLPAAATIAAGDDNAVQVARAFLARLKHEVDVNEGPDRQIRLLAAEQLMTDMDWARAEVVPTQLRYERAWHRVEEVQAELVKHQIASSENHAQEGGRRR